MVYGTILVFWKKSKEINVTQMCIKKKIISSTLVFFSRKIENR